MSMCIVEISQTTSSDIQSQCMVLSRPPITDFPLLEPEGYMHDMAEGTACRSCMHIAHADKALYKVRRGLTGATCARHGG